MLAALCICATASGVGEARFVPDTWVWPAYMPTFMPDEPVELQFDAQTNSELRVDVYAVPARRAIELIQQGRRHGEPAFSREHRVRHLMGPAGSWVRVSDNDDHHYLRTINIGRLSPGLYAVSSYFDGSTGIGLFQVTTLGTLVFNAGCGTYLFAQDLRTHRRLAGIRYVFVTPHGRRVARTGSDGSLCLRERLHDPTVGLGRAPDGAIAIQAIDLSRERDDDQERVAIQTDKYSYLSGETIRYRAVFRDGRSGAYRTPAGMRVIEAGGVKQTVTLDAYGTAAGQFTAELRTGLDAPEQMRISSSDALGKSYVLVFPRDKPFVPEPGLMSIHAEAPAFVGGTPVRFALAARSGASAAGRVLSYHTGYSYDDLDLSRNYHLRGGSRRIAEPQDTSGTLTLDALGDGEIHVPTPEVDAEHLMQIFVEGKGQPVLHAEGRAFVTPASFFLAVFPERFFSAPGEEVTLLVGARNYASDAQIPASIDLSVSELTYDRRSKSLRRIPFPGDSRHVETQSGDPARTLWRPPHAGLFEVTASAHDAAGRIARSTWYHWVTPSTFDTRLEFERPQLMPEVSDYAPDRPARILATIPRGGSDGLLIVSEAGRLPEVRVVRLPAKLNVLQVHVDPGTIRAEVMLALPVDSIYRWPRAFVTFAQPQARLAVRIEPEGSKQYCGQPARIHFDTTTGANEPARTQIALSVVDETTSAVGYHGLFPRLYLSGPQWFEKLQSWSMMPERSLWATQMPSILSDPQPATDPQKFIMSYNARDPELTAGSAQPTAFWSPNVETDAQGHADVTFTWPDVPGTYTVRASAISKGAAAGDATAYITVEKPAATH